MEKKEPSKLDIQLGRTHYVRCKCGTEWHRPGAKYCTHCGAKLENDK